MPESVNERNPIKRLSLGIDEDINFTLVFFYLPRYQALQVRTQFSEAEPAVLKVQFIASFHDRKVISQAACAKDDDRVAPRDLPVVPHLAFDVGRHMYCDPQSTEMIRQASMSVFCLRDTEVGIETLPAACEGVPPSRVGPLDTAANHRPRSVLPGSLMATRLACNLRAC